MSLQLEKLTELLHDIPGPTIARLVVPLNSDLFNDKLLFGLSQGFVSGQQLANFLRTIELVAPNFLESNSDDIKKLYKMLKGESYGGETSED